MKLSEAIRLGATMKPQAFNGEIGDTSCALTAAADAAGVEPFWSDLKDRYIVHYGTLRMMWPVLSAAIPCPRCNYYPNDDLMRTIYHLNDFHRWSRERIADFVELHEPLPVAEEAPADAQQEVL